MGARGWRGWTGAAGKSLEQRLERSEWEPCEDLGKGVPGRGNGPGKGLA